jgi:hypothetical protein
MKIFLILAMLVGISFGSDKKVDVLSAGNFSIRVPGPKNMQEVSGMKALDPLIASFGSSANVVLGAYFSKEYIESFPNNQGLANQWATILVAKYFEYATATKAQYLELVGYAKKNNDIFKGIGKKRMQDEEDRLNDAFKDNYGFDANLTLNIPKTIPGLAYESERYYGSVFLLKIDSNETAVGTVAFLFVNNKIITVNNYRLYHSSKDIEIVIDESKKWLDSIVKENEFMK